jgi:predicted restriction endonuclease
MKKHTKLVCDFYGYGEQDFIQCFKCGNEATGGTHHIKYKSAGGKDELENLIPLCKKHHDHAHRIGGWIDPEELYEIVRFNMKQRTLDLRTSDIYMA